MRETAYLNLNFYTTELKHKYGENVHILSNPHLLTLLSKICHPEWRQPYLGTLIQMVFQELAYYIASYEFPRKKVFIPTRMFKHHKEAFYEGEIISDDVKVVCVNIARAGTLPSQITFETFCYLLNPKNVRQDHIFMNRKTNVKGEVVGVDLSGNKIGGEIKNRIIIIPDPMGATGISMSTVIELYKPQKPKKIISAHLIVTPEYIKKIKSEHPDTIIYAVRLDRSLSANKILKTVPGTNLESECGLDRRQYIVPGAGGVGELINNAEM